MKIAKRFINDSAFGGVVGYEYVIKGNGVELAPLWKCFCRNWKKGGNFCPMGKYPDIEADQEYLLHITPDLDTWSVVSIYNYTDYIKGAYNV